MGAGTWESHHAITALLYRYAECIDAADFDGIGALFADGKITNEGYRGAIVGRDAVHDLYAGTNRVHSDGTLRTRHLATNVFVDIDESAGTATARSAFVVFQATRCPPVAADRRRPLSRCVRTRRARLALHAPPHPLGTGGRRTRTPDPRPLAILR